MEDISLNICSSRATQSRVLRPMSRQLLELSKEETPQSHRLSQVERFTQRHNRNSGEKQTQEEGLPQKLRADLNAPKARG